MSPKLPNSTHKIAQMIDHTLLKPQAVSKDIQRLCAEARQHQFYSVCVQPNYVALAAQELNGSPVIVCSVIGFPLGANKSTTKAFEAKQAIADGAGELDMVIDLSAAKAGHWNVVMADILAVVEAAGKIPVKVILETCLLNDAEIVKACEAAKGAGAAFVKTSTGFGAGGATTEAVSLMKATVGEAMQVKASGGIRTLEDLLAMTGAGATRIGASAGVGILAEMK